MLTATDQSAIEKHIEAYTDALCSGDLAGWLDTLTDDCVFQVHGMPAIQGKDAIRTWAEASYFGPFNVELESGFEELETLGPKAIGLGWFRQTLTPKDGSAPIPLKGKFLAVYQDQGDQWVLARCAFSTDHP